MAAKTNVAVALPPLKAKLTAKEFNKATKIAGLVKVDYRLQKALRDIGLCGQQMGEIAISQGRSMVLGSKLNYWLEKTEELEQQTSDPQIRLNCITAAAALIRTAIVNESNLVKTFELRGGVVSEVNQGLPRNQSFLPGQQVPNTVNLQVNVGERKEPSVESTNGASLEPVND